MKKLTPPDLERCQAEKSNGVNFMTCGGRHEMIRCENKPTCVAKENKPGKDGRRGSMSLCDPCAKVFVKQMGKSYATLKPINEKALSKPELLTKFSYSYGCGKAHIKCIPKAELQKLWDMHCSNKRRDLVEQAILDAYNAHKPRNNG
jgi:hypothetical protein